MPKILIVDDSRMDRQLAARVLQKHTAWAELSPDDHLDLSYAEDGAAALSMINASAPDLVLTDLNMPNMDGLQLVEEVRIHHRQVPVILMTAQGSDEIALRALRSGAASFVPKKLLAQELLETVLSVLESANASRSHARLLDCLTACEAHFTLANDPALIPPLVGYLKDSRFRVCGSDETGLVRVTMALREAVLNAMHHGNLELASSLREGDEREYHRLARERMKQPPYCDRRVIVRAADTPDGSVYVIRDEGSGFDPTKLPDPLDPENMEKVSGRGLLLIRTFMDEVRFNPKGNEITMIKHGGD
jgi:CheY-like chemotaxis protein/anti-sigma regulatory factor (Ser/Thr protein kinase)